MIEGLLLLFVLVFMVILLSALQRGSKKPEEKSLGFFAYHESIALKNSKVSKKANGKGGYA